MSQSGNGDRPELPEGWEWADLEFVAGQEGLFVDGDWILSADLKTGKDVRLLQLGDIGVGEFLDKSSKWISRERYEELGCTEVQAGDILISRMAEPIARACRLPDMAYTCITAVDVTICRVRNPRIDPDWVVLALNSPPLRLAAERLSSGTTRKRITRKKLGKLPLPVPPLEEQRRIVERISELWSEIGCGEDFLTDVDSHLVDFDAALLEAACLGRLIYSPVDGDDAGLSALPCGWEWVTLADIAADQPRSITDGPFGSNLKSSHYTEDGPRVIRLQNIGEGVFLDAEAHISQEHFQTLRTHEAIAGDVVLAALGKTLPRACVVPDSLGEAIVKADCQRIRLRPEVNPHFVAACLNSRPVRDQAKARVHGVGRPRLKLADAKQLRLPFPSREEQDAIVVRLRETQARAAALRAVRDDALGRADGLKRSLLREAVSGRMM